MAAADDLLVAFEYHSPEMIRDALAAGADPRALIKGKTPIDCLIEMYSRSKRFADCLRTMFDAGATLDDPALTAVLLDDAEGLLELLRTGAFVVEQIFNLECTFTSLQGVSALHICAEYNSVNCARVLLDAGADVDARAALDEDGLGGHTALFHTVNSNRNFAGEMMRLLVERGANLDIPPERTRMGRRLRMGDGRIRHLAAILRPVRLVPAVPPGRG